jgi:predicted PurR-regulated permease PerM
MSTQDPGAAGLTFYRRVFALAVVALLGLLLLRVLAPFAGPLAWGIVLAFLLHPLHGRLTRLCRGRDALAAGLLTGLTFVLILGPLALFGSAFVAQSGTLASALERLVTEIRAGNVGDLLVVPGAQPLLDWLQQRFGVEPVEVRDWLAAAGESLLQPLLGLGREALFGALGTVVHFVMMLFLLFFLLRDGESMVRAALGLVPMPVAARARLATHIGAVTRAVTFGTLATALLQGVAVAIAFAITRLPSPIVFGAVAAVMSVVPIAGTALVWAPAAIWLLATGHDGGGIFLVLWCAVAAALADNVVRPLLISGRTEVPALAVFIGVLGGLAAFGLIGMVLGPLLISLAIVLVRAGDEALLSR